MTEEKLYLFYESELIERDSIQFSRGINGKKPLRLPNNPLHIPSREEVGEAAKKWKEALGINPYRLQADQDFQAGAITIIDHILKSKQQINKRHGQSHNV